MLPALPRNYFDLVFVDGIIPMRRCWLTLTAAAGLIKEGGVLCGDDLERQGSEIDQNYARTQIESDYIRDPRSGHEYHPGVTLAVGDLSGRSPVWWDAGRLENEAPDGNDSICRSWRVRKMHS